MIWVYKKFLSVRNYVKMIRESRFFHSSSYGRYGGLVAAGVSHEIGFPFWIKILAISRICLR